MSTERSRVRVVAEAKEMLRKIGKKYGKKTYEVLRDLIQELEFEPEMKGEALGGPLHGLHSLHYSRFRVIYRIEKEEAVVLVVATGHHESGARDDIYQILERLVDSGSIVIPKRQPPD